jgi:cell division protein ZapA
MANVNIKFNNKDYLLSCDEGQEESLKKLTSFLDKKYNDLENELGSIGENKLLLITTIQIIDDFFNLKHRVDLQKNKLNEMSKNFLEMKFLAIQYKEKKDIEINNLNVEIDKLKVMIEDNNSIYESVLDRTTKSLQDIISNTESKSKFQ